MLYWLFTEGQVWAKVLIVPAGAVTMILTLILASQTKQAGSCMKMINHLALSIALSNAFVLLLNATIVQRGHANLLPMIDWVVGAPASIDGRRILSFSTILMLILIAGNLLLAQQLKPASALHEWLNLLKRPYSKRGEVGSSHFCTPSEFRRFRTPPSEGITLDGAFWGERNRRLDSGSEKLCLSSEDTSRGILALGSPGSGKSQAVILPIIAQKMQVGHSLIVADPQGELTPYILQLAGLSHHTIAIHDPTQINTPRFNLADDVHTVSDARAIADVLVSRLPGDNQFWSDAASSVLAACLLRFKTLGEIYSALADVNTLVDQFNSREDDARYLANNFMASVKNDGKVAANIVSTLATALTGWASAAVRENTASSDFKAAILIKQPTVIILTCPGRMRQVYAPYLGAVLRRLMLDLDTLGEHHGGALPKPITIVMDEFPTLGRLDGLVADINLVRKRRITIVIAAQTRAQLQHIYGTQGADVLLSGLATQIVFGGCDTHTANYYSQASGQASVGNKKDDFVRPRLLLTLDEVQSPPRGNCLIFMRYTERDYAAQLILSARLRRFYESNFVPKTGQQPYLLPRRNAMKLLDQVPVITGKLSP